VNGSLRALRCTRKDRSIKLGKKERNAFGAPCTLCVLLFPKRQHNLQREFTRVRGISVRKLLPRRTIRENGSKFFIVHAGADRTAFLADLTACTLESDSTFPSTRVPPQRERRAQASSSRRSGRLVTTRS